LNIAFAGNLWEKTDRDGNVLDRPGLITSNPWIGDPDDPASMESARKVRHALAMGYDRSELNDVLASGLGWETSIGYFNDKAPEFQDRWKVEFDPDAAKDLLAEAGYPNGFDIEIFGQSDTRIRQEMAQAVGAMWQQNLGLNVTVQSYEYSVFRPTIVDRSASIPFMNSCDDGRFPRPWDWPVGLVTSSLSRGGFSCGLEAPLIRDNFLKSANEGDIVKRRALTDEVADYFYTEMLMPSTVTFPVVLVYNPRSIAEWNMRPSLSGPITSPELIVPGAR
jgi:ABC-type transport system substrate-binding protein